MPKANKVETVKPFSPPYREGTEVAMTQVSLVFNAGGMGDYIHWIGAIKYAIDSNPHIYGHILAPPYFYELALLWLGNYSKRFEVVEYDSLDKNPYLESRAAIAPNTKQYAHACGFHLTDLGFVYFTQRNTVVKEYASLPKIEGNEACIAKFNLPERYAVIATEATSLNRRLPAETINVLTKHLIANGVTPVFMGKHFMAPDHKAEAAEGINTEGILDLREKTSLKEAACIMTKSKFVVGADGGLLHLACCSDVPVIFVFTTVHPDYRVPYYREAPTFTISPPETLLCRFCNTGSPTGKNMSYVIGHDFKHCLYKDNLCTKSISPENILPTIDKIIEGKITKWN